MGPDSKRSFKIALEGHSPLVYSVVRQLALMAHFPNFDEEKHEFYSTITILYPKEFEIKDLEAAIDVLAGEEYLFNLIKYSNYHLVDAKGDMKSHPGLTFLDIEFVLKATDHYQPSETEIQITEDDIKNYTESKVVASFTDEELTAAMLVNQAYSTGAEIRNLASTENDKASRYGMALKCLNSTKRKKARVNWKDCFRQDSEGKFDMSCKNVLSILSCIFCADTFESRLNQIMAVPEKITHKFLIKNLNTIRSLIAKNLLSLSKSEHARWNAEKLILGFRPLNAEESFTDEISIGQRDDYRSDLKNRSLSPSHIDILSFADLKRINPEDQKYDSFIMLAIPTILIQKYLPHKIMWDIFSHII